MLFASMPNSCRAQSIAVLLAQVRAVNSLGSSAAVCIRVLVPARGPPRPLRPPEEVLPNQESQVDGLMMFDE